MSAKATFWAWEQDVNHTSKIVLLALANFANDDGYSWHSYESIAKACGLNRRSVIRHCQSLQDMGLLTINERKKGEKMNLSNVFRLHVFASIDQVEVVTESHWGGDRESLGSDRESPKPKKESKIETKKKEKEKKETLSLEEIPDCVDKDQFVAYLAIRKEMKLKNTKPAIKILTNKLISFEKASKGAAQQALENAIEGSWKRLHMPDRIKKPTQNNLDQNADYGDGINDF